MNDEPTDDISRKRKERHERSRDRQREFVDTIESLQETVENGANALLDYRDATERLRRHLLGSIHDGVLNIAVNVQNRGEVDLGAEVRSKSSNVSGLMKYQAIAMIEARAEELATPDLRLLVVPLDGDPPDASHNDLVDSFAIDIIAAGPDGAAAVLLELEDELRKLARPAFLVEMHDDMVHEFFWDTDDVEEEGPAS